MDEKEAEARPVMGTIFLVVHPIETKQTNPMMRFPTIILVSLPNSIYQVIMYLPK